MTTRPVLEGVAVALAIIFLAELGSYFRDPVAPDEQHLTAPVEHEPLGYDPTRPPGRFARGCRDEGLQYVAYRHDMLDWEHKCIKARHD